MKPTIGEATLVILLLSAGFSTLSAFYTRQFYYINRVMSWTEAQTYCRNRFDDLATIDNPTDNKRLLKLAKRKNSKEHIWIGFNDDIKRWKWTMDDKEYYVNDPGDFFTWLTNQPNNFKGNQFCTNFGKSFLLNDLPCDTALHFICYDANTTQSHVLVEKEYTWSKARAYCRKHHKDLASIRNKEEYNDFKLTIKNPNELKAWIGLYREWEWSDKSPVSYTNWRIGEPNHEKSTEDCGAFNTNSGEWVDIPCELKKNVFCTEVVHKQTILKVKFSSKADVNSKEVQEQISKQLQANMESKQMTVFKIKWRNVQRYCENKEKKPDEEVKCTDAV